MNSTQLCTHGRVRKVVSELIFMRLPSANKEYIVCLNTTYADTCFPLFVRHARDTQNTASTHSMFGKYSNVKNGLIYMYVVNKEIIVEDSGGQSPDPHPHITQTKLVPT